jgi:predicted transcriptional regulator
MVNFLKHRQWTNRATVAKELGMTVRKVRAAVSASGAEIISGQKGLCLLKNADLEDIQKSNRQLSSMIRNLERRLIAQRKRAHQLAH